MKNLAKYLLASILLATPLMVAVNAAPPDAGPSGPIDIQANEQEFAENGVIAKGNVRVVYKDSVVLAPMATLFKDATGNPQKAIFTGHPHLTQGKSKIDADTLTFEIANSRIIAEGHAHSEVLSDSDSSNEMNTAMPSKAAPVKIDGEEGSSEGDTAPAPVVKAPEAKPAVAKKQEKIITDSDRQEYDRSSGKFEALGNVRVTHGDIGVKSDKLSLVYGLDGKPETAVFTGNVNATQNKNSTMADTMTYSLSTKRLQATGHVKSTVIQEEKKGTPAGKKKAIGFIDPLGMPAANASNSATEAKDDVIVITSEVQDYSKNTGRMSASGNVKVFYQDIIGAGPTCIMIRNDEGKAERIIFAGRSQLSQPGRRWIADRIEMTVADKKVLATGNTKALLLQSPTKARPQPVQQQYQVAGRANGAAISATKVDVPK